MSSLPLILPNGIIAIYGTGDPNSSNNAIVATEKVLFGNVSKVWEGGEIFVYNGDNVMFAEKDIMGRVAYQGVRYTLVPARLATKEEPPL